MLSTYFATSKDQIYIKIMFSHILDISYDVGILLKVFFLLKKYKYNEWHYECIRTF